MKLTEKNRKIKSVRFGFNEPLGDKEYHNSVGDFINIVMTVQRKRGIRITDI